MSADELRSCAARVGRLPVVETEYAHAERDCLALSLRLLADVWGVSPAARRAIVPGQRTIKQHVGVRTVRVEVR